MPDEMPFSWRSLAKASTSRLSMLKGYIGQLDQGNIRASTRSLVPQSPGQQGWKQWANQKIKERRQNNSQGVPLIERITLFPGWATKRYAIGRLDNQFEIDIFVSGYASSHRPFDLATRSQRAFLRLAKGFASLPKLVAEAAENAQEPTLRLSPSTEELLRRKNLPPRPDEITEELEIQALEKQFRNAAAPTDFISCDSSVDGSSVDDDSLNAIVSIPGPPNPAMQTLSRADILRLHNNLESRIQPFWSSVLSSRTVRVHIFTASQYARSQSLAFSREDDEEYYVSPLATADVKTSVDGSFQHRLNVKWEQMCRHPHALEIAFSKPTVEHELVVVAQLLPPPMSISRASSSSSVIPSPINDSNDDNAPASASALVVLTHSPIRIISDIDDTVKQSNILSGPRAIFHNVFVKDLKDAIIPGMGEWYTRMWKQGVRFHYVSNGPFELLPLVNEFFQISQLPPGSVKLRSYAGRSLFNGLLSAPAARKRAGVVEILDSFPESRFILIGDSGEQDLELYTEVAQQRVDQILAVFIRDVEAGEPLDDPTGSAAILDPQAILSPSRKSSFLTTLSNASSSSLSLQNKRTKGIASGRTSPSTPAQTNNQAGYFPSQQHLSEEPEDLSAFSSYQGNTPIANSTPTPKPKLTIDSTHPGVSSSAASSGTSRQSATASEKRRWDLQLRVYRARTIIPEQVRFRVFRSPDDCVEAEEILISTEMGDSADSSAS